MNTCILFRSLLSLHHNKQLATAADHTSQKQKCQLNQRMKTSTWNI